MPYGEIIILFRDPTKTQTPSVNKVECSNIRNWWYFKVTARHCRSMKGSGDKASSFLNLCCRWGDQSVLRFGLPIGRMFVLLRASLEIARSVTAIQ